MSGSRNKRGASISAEEVEVEVDLEEEEEADEDSGVSEINSTGSGSCWFRLLLPFSSIPELVGFSFPL